MTNLCINCQTLIERPTIFEDLVFWKSIDTDLICDKCRQLFKKTPVDSICPGCSKLNQSNELCSDCLHWQQDYPDIPGRHKSLYVYNDFAKEWMIQFKMRGDIRFGLVFGEQLSDSIKNDFPDHLIVPIPSSAKNLKERGFNQIEVILDVLSVEYSHLLINQSNDLNQSTKTREERLKTTQPFSCVEDIDLQSVKVLLIDDVYTTGRTLFHAKNVLFEHGAARVDSLSLFR